MRRARVLRRVLSSFSASSSSSHPRGPQLLLSGNHAANAAGYSSDVLVGRRTYSSDAPPGIGLVFDIDGVLARGGKALAAASVVRERLVSRDGKTWRVPTVFLTNGGGVTEAAKAAELSRVLGGGVEVSEHQVALSHTPFRGLAHLKHRPVLVAGRGGVGAVARAYGFRSVVTTRELALADPRALPFRTPADFAAGGAAGQSKGPGEVGEGYGSAGGDRGGGEEAASSSSSSSPPPPQHFWGTPLAPFAAVLVFSDPHDWYADMQLLIDVCETRGAPLPLPAAESSNSAAAAAAAALRAKHDGPQGASSFEGVFFSNPDVEFAGTHPRPRFGQGSFACAFSALHHAIVERERGLPPLRASFFGKPTAAAARLAEKLLVRHAAEAVGVPGAAGAAEALDELERRRRGLHDDDGGGAPLSPETGAPVGEVGAGAGGGESGAAAARARRDVLSSVFPGGIFMVGDNPRADVRGARRAGAPWVSALVRTGVFSGADNDATDPADLVVADARAAVEAALHRGRFERWHRHR
jgi:HAD superfamily hydrolase (TIGR01450 family)